jgi:hypothetical protein
MAGGIRIATCADYDDRPVQLQPSARLTGDQEPASAAWLARTANPMKPSSAIYSLSVGTIRMRGNTSLAGPAKPMLMQTTVGVVTSAATGALASVWSPSLAGWCRLSAGAGGRPAALPCLRACALDGELTVDWSTRTISGQ